MSTHVPLQITRCSKTLLANFTFIRFLVRVNTHVDFQTSSLTKSFIAHITLIRYLVRLNTQMSVTNTHKTQPTKRKF